MKLGSVRSQRLGVGLALALCWSGRALAAGDAEPIRVVYRAEPACSSGAEFLRAVLARTGRARSAAANESARTFHVSITAGDDGKLSGDFSVTAAEAEQRASDKRTIVGESCREVFDALTLFAALSVDPGALTSAPTPSTAPEIPTPEPAPVRAPPPGAQTPASGAISVIPFRAGVGCDVGTTNASTRSALLLVEPFAEARFAHPQARVALAPTVRLGFTSVGGDTPSSNAVDGPAHLHWTTLRLDGCPAELGLVGSLVVRPCVALTGGALEASGESVAHPRSHTLGWWALGALFRLEWSPARMLSFEASAALDVPVRRDAFYFDPDPSNTVYRAPAVLGRGEAGISLHFL